MDSITGGQLSFGSSVSNQFGTGNAGDWWKNLLMPGYSAFNQMFDMTGQYAAQNQFNNQMLLDNAARSFNASEAEKQRAWEEMMSNTQYQRAAADLKAAGLNPWLAVQNGGMNGSTPSGSSASASSGSASQANNKLAIAAGLIATALRMFLAKH